MRGTWGEMWRKGRQLAAATAAVALTGVGLTSGAARAADGPTLPTQSYAIITAPAQIAVPAVGHGHRPRGELQLRRRRRGRAPFAGERQDGDRRERPQGHRHDQGQERPVHDGRRRGHLPGQRQSARPVRTLHAQRGQPARSPATPERCATRSRRTRPPPTPRPPRSSSAPRRSRSPHCPPSPA